VIVMGLVFVMVAVIVVVASQSVTVLAYVTYLVIMLLVVVVIVVLASQSITVLASVTFLEDTLSPRPLLIRRFPWHAWAWL